MMTVAHLQRTAAHPVTSELASAGSTDATPEPSVSAGVVGRTAAKLLFVYGTSQTPKNKKRRSEVPARHCEALQPSRRSKGAGRKGTSDL